MSTLHQKNIKEYEVPITEAIELARGHHMLGNFILAERTYHDILQVVPENPTVNHLLGAMYYQLNNTKKAFEYMKKSTELDSNEKQYWSNLGSLFYVNDDFDEAIQCFDRALTIDPEHLEALNRKSLVYWQIGSFRKAEICAVKSLHLSNDNLDGFMNLGLSQSGQKLYKKANQTWKSASEKYPDNVQIWSNWANTLREMRHFKQAKEKIDKALELSPDDADSLNNLGCILRDTGRYEEAITAFTKTTNIKPKAYSAHYNMALIFHDLHKYEEAIIAARYAIDFNESYGDAYNILSSSLTETGQFSQAHFAAQRAVQLEPDRADAYLNLADVLYVSNAFDDGHAALKEALKRDPDNAQAYSKLASIYERLDEVDEALSAINKAIELAPHMASFLAKKASILHIANQIDEALVVIDEALQLSPLFVMAMITKAEILVAVNKNNEAMEILESAKKINPKNPLIYFTITTIKKFKTIKDEDFQMMLFLEAQSEKMGITTKSSLYYALARAYEDIKEYQKSFEFLDKANQEKRSILPYDSEKSSQMFEQVKSSYTAEMLKHFEGKGFASDIPIFIVGMPRSGTTLTEQIISSHPDVFGAGELPDIGRAKKKIGTITPENIKDLGTTYVELVRARDKTGTAQHIVDKMPANYMSIGLILQMLPNAKIIHCCRNPMDTCLSNYKQNFMVGQFWSYNLKDMGDEYLRYLDLMEFWHQKFPDRILDVHYEETVSDLEAQAHKLIDFIGLEWDEACLQPHKQKRSVLTASKAQVTKPIYKTSVQKWKLYEKELQPLIDLFRKNNLTV